MAVSWCGGGSRLQYHFSGSRGQGIAMSLVTSWLSSTTQPLKKNRKEGRKKRNRKTEQCRMTSFSRATLKFQDNKVNLLPCGIWSVKKTLSKVTMAIKAPKAFTRAKPWGYLKVFKLPTRSKCPSSPWITTEQNGTSICYFWWALYPWDQRMSLFFPCCCCVVLFGFFFIVFLFFVLQQVFTM